MNIVKRIFLRSCVNHGTISTSMAEDLLASLSETYKVPKPSIKDFVKEINESIAQYNQKLAFYKHPLAEEAEFLIFAVTFETDVCKMQMHYSEGDRHYFLKVIEACVRSEDFGILWMDAFNVLQDKKLPKIRIQELLKTWVKQGYFLSKNDKIYVGPRMLLEYGTHLKINYSELLDDCPLCKTLVLWDIKCGDCGVRIHRDCIRKYLIRQNNCPQCKRVWTTRLSLNTETNQEYS